MVADIREDWPNRAASRCRTAAPPSVPTTAPATPSTRPAAQKPEADPIAAPQTAPMKMRAPNCGGTLRLGVEGSWSVTSSTSASTLNMPTAQGEARKESHEPERSRRPR